MSVLAIGIAAGMYSCKSVSFSGFENSQESKHWYVEVSKGEKKNDDFLHEGEVIQLYRSSSAVSCDEGSTRLATKFCTVVSKSNKLICSSKLTKYYVIKTKLGWGAYRYLFSKTV